MDAGPADDGGMDAGSADAGDAGAPPPLPTIKGIFAATCASSATCACDSAGCWAKQGTQVYSAEVYGSTAFTATLSDPADPRIAAVEFLANGAMFATVSMSPLTGTLDTTTLDDGQITVSAQLVLAGGALADNRPLALALTLDNCDRDHDFAFKAGCGKFPVDCNDNDPAVGACSGGAPFCDATLLKCVCHPFNPQTFQSDTCQNASQGACDTFGGAPTCKPSCFQDTDCTGPGQFCDDQTFCRTYCPSDAACPSGRCVHATPPATTSPLTYAANHFKCEACAASDANACAAPTAATCAACVGATNACVSAACGCTGGGTPSDSCVALGQGVCASGACVACGADGTACAGGHGWACLSGQCVATGWSPLWAEPPARLGASVVFDSDKNRLVMFGGYSQAVYPSANPSYPYGDLWSLSLDVNDPAHGLWTRLVAQGTPPLARSRHVAVYDAPNKRMIVFGGLAGHNPGGDAEPQSDTWQLSFGGAVPTWTELNTGFLIPPKRELAAAALVTDTTPPQLIVIGGLTLDAFYSQHPSNDVWSLSLDANPRWTQLTPAGTPPSARFGAAAAYVPGRGVYLYGGSTMPSSAQSSAGSDALSDAYYLALGNLAWASLSPGGAQPGPRTQASAAYDVAGNRVLLFGGTDNAATPTLHSDVFALSPNLDQWTALSPANAASVPVALDWGAAFAPSTRTLYAYAGDAVWALDPAAGWSAAAQSPAWHSRPALLDDSAAGGRIYAAGTFSLSSNTYSSLDVWSFQHATGLWRQASVAGAPAANVISFLVPSTAQRKLFAMSAAGSDYSHLAVFDAAAGTWTSTVLSNPIGACQLPATQACTTPSDCDPTGTGKSTCITSVNGSFCAPCSYSNYPQVHDDAITFFDDANSRLVVSAGLNNGSTPYVQQWSIRYPWTSASQWTELVDAGAKLINPAYAYDSANKRLVVFGGADYATSNIASNDVWFVDLLNPAAPGSYGAWTKQTIAGRLPLPRKNASAVVMNSGKANAQLVVFGGYVVGTANGDGNDVWALSLPPAATLGWRQLCPGGALPQNRMFPSLTLVAAENALGLFGGWTGGSTLANYGKGGVFFNYDASFWELSPQTPFDDGTCPWRF